MSLLTGFAPYAALGVTILVWVLTQLENRKHEVFKERLKRRVELFDGLLPAMVQFIAANTTHHPEPDNQQSELANSTWHTLLDYRVKIECYGTESEHESYEEFLKAINEKQNEEFSRLKTKLAVLSIKSLRRELGFKH